MYSICVSVTLCFVSGRQGEFGTCQFVSKLRGKIKGINLSVDKNSELLRVALGPPGHLSTSGTSSGDGVGPASLGEGKGHLEGAQCLPAVTVWNWGTSPPNPALLTFLLERKATQANQEAGAGLPAVLPETRRAGEPGTNLTPGTHYKCFCQNLQGLLAPLPPSTYRAGSRESPRVVPHTPPLMLVTVSQTLLSLQNQPRGAWLPAWLPLPHLHQPKNQKCPNLTLLGLV